MTYNNQLLRKLNLAKKGTDDVDSTSEEENDDLDKLMSDARYLRQSSTLINDALQKGFDVLQLSNGDVVTTGTKTVTYQYTWDEDKGKMVRVKTNGKVRRSSAQTDGQASEGSSQEEEERTAE